MNYPKVLLLANNALSLSNSNGRTLGNLFLNWPKNKLAQFCLMPSDPNWDLCDNYYCVSDKSALSSVLGIKNAIGRLVNSATSVSQTCIRSRIAKTPLSMLLRNFVWKIGRWKQQGFYKWADKFAPDIICLAVGDSTFMLDLAVDLSKRYNAQLVLYNSESYYLKDVNFMRRGVISDIVYKWYLSGYRKSFVKLINSSSLTVYGNTTLQKDYLSVFKHRSIVLYNSTNVTYTEHVYNSTNPRFSYLGNLGLDRHKELIKISKVLNGIDSRFVLDIYGPVPNSVVEHELNQSESISYKGIVSYDQVIEIMHASDVLFHVESFDTDIVADLKYAFSTKIPDSLASGTPFVLYSHPSLTCSQYIKEHNCAWYIGQEEELEQSLKILLSSHFEDEKIRANAKRVVEENHNADVNAEQFYHAVSSLVK